MAEVKQAMEEELDADAELLGLKRKKKPAAAAAEAAGADGAAAGSSGAAEGAAGDGTAEASTSGAAADDELVSARARGGAWGWEGVMWCLNSKGAIAASHGSRMHISNAM